MKPVLHRLGQSGSPVVVIDDFSAQVQDIVALAADLAPFPPAAGNHYPGVRRILEERDAAAFAYVTATLNAAAPFIGGAFDMASFDLLEASFSIVTAAPETLSPPQRSPHFDSTDPNYIAVLHYLSDTPDTGTAFYRQRSTGIEVVDDANVSSFVATARRESASRPATYVAGTDAHFEQIGCFGGRPDRLLLYRGHLLHSGLVAPDMVLSDDPRRGRLTANLFVLGRRS